MNGLIHAGCSSHANTSFLQTYHQLYPGINLRAIPFRGLWWLLVDGFASWNECKAEGVHMDLGATAVLHPTSQRATSWPTKTIWTRQPSKVQRGPPSGEIQVDLVSVLQRGPLQRVVPSGVTLRVQEQHCWFSLQSRRWKHHPKHGALWRSRLTKAAKTCQCFLNLIGLFLN